MRLKKAPCTIALAESANGAHHVEEECVDWRMAGCLVSTFHYTTLLQGKSLVASAPWMNSRPNVSHCSGVPEFLAFYFGQEELVPEGNVRKDEKTLGRRLVIC